MIPNTLLIKGVAILGGIALLTSGFFYVKFLLAKLDAAEQREATYQSVISKYQAQLDSYKDDLLKIQGLNEEVLETYEIAKEEYRSLQKRFEQTTSGNKRDLNFLAISKPGLIEKRINNGTKDALRCNELMTGAELNTNDDSNTICPDYIKSMSND